MGPEGTYLDALAAQVAYRFLQGDTPADILTWFQREYRHDPVANLYAVMQEAQQRAYNTEAYRGLGQNETFGSLLPPGADIYQEYPVYLVVGAPVPGHGTVWSTVRVNATPTTTRGAIEQIALETAQSRAQPFVGSGTFSEDQIDEPSIEMVRGLVL